MSEETTSKTKPKRVSKLVQLYPEEFDGCSPPAQLWKARRFGKREHILRNKKKVQGVLHLPGRGSPNPKIMFLSPCVLEEEVNTGFVSTPGVLRGAAASLFLRSIRRLGFKEEDWYYTTLCKYPVKKMKPTAQDIRWNEQMLKTELLRLKPKIVVCMGKPGFDFLIKLKFKLDEVRGGFFDCPEYDCKVFPMDNITSPLYKPEHLERFLVDLKELKREFASMEGVQVVKVATDYVTIDTAEKLQNLMTEFDGKLQQGMLQHVAVDAEWHGQTAWSRKKDEQEGSLRSLQLCWRPGAAAYIRFTTPIDGKPVYVMDRPLADIRPILQPLRDARLKFIGHNIAADGVWMEEHLDIPMYGRVAFDTMFCVHTLNEYADLKLERNAVKYTDLGRYDIPLLQWKKANKVEADVETGYGLVPDEIIIPYGLRDVDTTFRIYMPLLKQLWKQQLSDYYFSICLPFVTDGFMEMMRCGLPIDEAYLEKMRNTFSRNRNQLEEDFRNDLLDEAGQFLSAALVQIDAANGALIYDEICEARKSGNGDRQMAALEAMKLFAGAKEMPRILPIYEHWTDAKSFNINSADQMRRWLFNVKGLQPLKTTKKDGIQMSWERVKSLPLARQAEYTPAADKQTIKVFAGKDRHVAMVEELKLTGNILKAFLGDVETEVERKAREEEGAVREESGIFKWIQADGRVHCNFALTETFRPRSWKPNILNWPKAISKPVEKSFLRLNKYFAKKKFEEVRKLGWPTAEIRKTVAEQIIQPTSVRSATRALPGCVLIDNDLKTAEVVALAYVSGDPNMIKVLTDPDTQFARIDANDPKKVVRIAFNEISDYPQSMWDDRFITPLDDPRILRAGDGSILHPKRDVHWELGETQQKMPREMCDERMDRDGIGKVGNFSVPYGSAEANLERLIEANTGRKPPEGTGAKILETYQRRYPVAWRFLQSMEQIVEDPGYYRSVSGRVRHFFFNQLSDVEGLSEYARKGILSPLTRQARNFPIQELVAATTAKALIRFIKERNERGMRTQVMSLLYDALTLISPLEEAKLAAELIRNCMTIWVPWTIGPRTFNFEVDTAFTYRWGVKMTKQEKKNFEPYLR